MRSKFTSIKILICVTLRSIAIYIYFDTQTISHPPNIVKFSTISLPSLTIPYFTTTSTPSFPNMQQSNNHPGNSHILLFHKRKSELLINHHLLISYTYIKFHFIIYTNNRKSLLNHSIPDTLPPENNHPYRTSLF